MEFPQKLKVDLSYNPLILLLNIYWKECKLGYSGDTCTPMLSTALLTIAKLWKELRCPATDAWIKKNVI
jgi:hypothetical protein